MSLLSLWKQLVLYQSDSAALVIGSAAATTAGAEEVEEEDEEITIMEINEMSDLVSSVLKYQHGYGLDALGNGSSTSGGDDSKTVLIIIDQSSDVDNPIGEIIALISIIKCKCKWITLSLDLSSSKDINQYDSAQIKSVISLLQIDLAIVVAVDKKQEEVLNDKTFNDENEVDDDDNHVPPTYSVDENPYVKYLQKNCGIHRNIVLRRDGSIANGIPPSVIELKESEEIRQEDEEEEEEVQDEPWLNRCLYYICTSGSTNIPKIVAQTEGGLVGRLNWQWNEYPWNEGDEMQCRRTPLIFVDALAEIFGALLKGIPLFIPKNTPLKNGMLSFCQYPKFRNSVTRITLLPSQLLSSLRANPYILNECKMLSIINISGSEATLDLLNEFKKCYKHREAIEHQDDEEENDGEVEHKTKLINIYGSSEVSADVMCATLFDGSSNDVDTVEGCLPIYDGNELIGSNTTYGIDEGAYFEDKDAAGIKKDNYKIGELKIYGNCVGLGYIGNEKETDEKFINLNESEEKPRGFRTGDIVIQVKSTNNIYFIGRKDNQIKIRGKRIELDKVSRDISEILGKISFGNNLSVFCFSRKDILVCLIFTKAKAELNVRETLMSNMDHDKVPTIILFLDESVYPIPTTATGKVDKNAMKRLYEEGYYTNKKNYQSSKDDSLSDFQKSLVSLVRDTLEIPEEKCSDMEILNSRFETLGGDSLLAIEFSWRLSKSLGISIDVQILFDGRQLMNLLDSDDTNSNNDDEGNKKKDNVDSITASDSKRVKRVIENGVSYWKSKMNMCVDAEPLLLKLVETSSAYIFVGSQGGDFYCIESENGAMVWNSSVHGSIEGGANIVQGKGNEIQIIVPSFNSKEENINKKSGWITSFSAVNGNKNWEVEIEGEVKSRPSVDSTKGIIWVGTNTGVVIGLDGMRDGKIISKYKLPHPIHASVVPCSSLNDILCCTTIAGHVSFVKVDFDNDCEMETIYELDTGAPIYGSPVYSQERDLTIIGNMKGDIYAIQPLNQVKPIIWKIETGYKTIYPSINNCLKGVIFVSSQNGYVFGLDMEGKRLWNHKIPNSVVYSKPAARIGKENEISLFVCATSGVVYNIAVIGEKTRLVEVAKLNGEIFSNPTILINDKHNNCKLFIGCRDDYLHCIKIDT